MTLITKAQTEQLLANGIAQRAAIDQDARALDFKPVVKLFTPDAQCTWLLTEIDEGTDLDVGELQQLDRLAQLRRHDQRLRLAQVEARTYRHQVNTIWSRHARSNGAAMDAC